MNYDFLKEISQEYTHSSMGFKQIVTTSERDFYKKHIEPLRNTDKEKSFDLECDFNTVIGDIQENAFADGFSAGVCMILQCVKR